MPRSNAARLRIEKPDREVRPLAQRGRMMLVDDVLAMLPMGEDGQPIKGRWWVENSFAPELKRYLGRTPYWWEADVLTWLDQQLGVG